MARADWWRYNRRQVIIAIFKMPVRFIDVSDSQIEQFKEILFYFLE